MQPLNAQSTVTSSDRPDMQTLIARFRAMPLAEQLQRKCELYNADRGTFSDPACPLCYGKGYVAKCDDTRDWLESCGCVERMKSERLMVASGLSSLVDRYTFDSFTATHEWQKRLKERALAYVDNHEDKWLAILGQPGCGKTHLGTAVAVEIMRRRNCTLRYMAWRDDIVRIKASVNDDSEYQRLISPFKTAQILYIDDFFKCERGKTPTTGDLNAAFELLNYRYNNPQLVTILSSEHTVDDMLTFDEAIGSRIHQRTKGNCLVINRDRAKNYRLAGGDT